MSETKLQLTTVPYRGTAPVMNDLIGKQIDMACDQATNTTGPILGKQIKAYAVTTKARLKTLADVPTADEAGLKGFELDIWHGIFAPKGTPPAIVQKLSAALRTALKDPDLIKRFSDISTEWCRRTGRRRRPRSARCSARSTAGRRSSRRLAVCGKTLATAGVC